jgi:hypothetical protein
MNLPAETAFVILLACAAVCGSLLLRSRRRGLGAVVRTGVLCTMVAVVGSQFAIGTMAAALQAG